MKTLIPRVQRCMKQNNTVNIYEEYFQEKETDHCSEPPFAKGLAVFRDPSQLTRSTTSVNWHPEGSNNGKLAVSYAVLNFQDERLNSPNLPASVSYCFIYMMCVTSYHICMLIHHSLPFYIKQELHLGYNQLQQTNRRACSTISTVLPSI